MGQGHEMVTFAYGMAIAGNTSLNQSEFQHIELGCDKSEL